MPCVHSSFADKADRRDSCEDSAGQTMPCERAALALGDRAKASDVPVPNERERGLSCARRAHGARAIGRLSPAAEACEMRRPGTSPGRMARARSRVHLPRPASGDGMPCESDLVCSAGARPLSRTDGRHEAAPPRALHLSWLHRRAQAAAAAGTASCEARLRRGWRALPARLRSSGVVELRSSRFFGRSRAKLGMLRVCNSASWVGTDGKRGCSLATGPARPSPLDWGCRRSACVDVPKRISCRRGKAGRAR